jgi:hypothetical protein
VDIRVVVDNQLAVGAQTHIEFHHVRLHLNGTDERLDGVLTCCARRASVRSDKRNWLVLHVVQSCQVYSGFGNGDADLDHSAASDTGRARSIVVVRRDHTTQFRGDEGPDDGQPKAGTSRC